jgi:hypothetical protein
MSSSTKRRVPANSRVELQIARQGHPRISEVVVLVVENLCCGQVSNIGADHCHCRAPTIMLFSESGIVLWDADVRDPTCQIAETGELTVGAYSKGLSLREF